MKLYHFVPSDQEGAILYPLNELAEQKPHLYQKHIAKYSHLREIDVQIPDFGSWNDCLNLMPVRPDLIKKELEAHSHPTNWQWRFYEIESDELDQDKLRIMISDFTLGAITRHFLPLTPDNCSGISEIPEATKSLYRAAKERGEQPLTFAGIPHVLYKGNLDTTRLRIIDFT